MNQRNGWEWLMLMHYIHSASCITHYPSMPNGATTCKPHWVMADVGRCKSCPCSSHRPSAAHPHLMPDAVLVAELHGPCVQQRLTITLQGHLHWHQPQLSARHLPSFQRPDCHQ